MDSFGFANDDEKWLYGEFQSLGGPAASALLMTISVRRKCPRKIAGE